MKILVWCSLALWLNVAWAESTMYHNPFVATGVKMSRQISPYSSHQSMRESLQINPMFPTDVNNDTKEFG